MLRDLAQGEVFFVGYSLQDVSARALPHGILGIVNLVEWTEGVDDFINGRRIRRFSPCNSTHYTLAGLGAPAQIPQRGKHHAGLQYPRPRCIGQDGRQQGPKPSWLRLCQRPDQVGEAIALVQQI